MGWNGSMGTSLDFMMRFNGSNGLILDVYDEMERIKWSIPLMFMMRRNGS
jgi:hypothetical protein